MVIVNIERLEKQKKIVYPGKNLFFGYPGTNLIVGYPWTNLFFGYSGIRLRDTPVCQNEKKFAAGIDSGLLRIKPNYQVWESVLRLIRRYTYLVDQTTNRL